MVSIVRAVGESESGYAGMRICGYGGWEEVGRGQGDMYVDPIGRSVSGRLWWMWAACGRRYDGVTRGWLVPPRCGKCGSVFICILVAALTHVMWSPTQIVMGELGMICRKMGREVGDGRECEE